MPIILDLVATTRNVFRMARATFNAAGLTAARTFTLPDVAGTLALVDGRAAVGSLTAQATINATITFTAAATALASQVAIANAAWRVNARGTFVAANSATPRNAQIAVFWGGTQLPAIIVPVLLSVAQTTTWDVEFEITATSTTAVFTAGSLIHTLSSATALAMTNAAPASTVVSAGNQTVGLRVNMSAVVAGDAWVLQSTVIERIR